MYHLQLRQFPHNFCRFNLTEQALRETVLDAWVRDAWVEAGERSWSSQQSNLTVIEGPELPIAQLSMGRGWRNALRQGTDVTAQVLAGARARLGVADTASPDVPEQGNAPPPGTAKSAWAALTGPAPGAAGGSSAGPPPGDLQAGGQPASEDALARQLLSLLGENPALLLRAWQLAMEQHPDRTPSQCLAAAEDFVRR